jgi:hypothetical protein
MSLNLITVPVWPIWLMTDETVLRALLAPLSDPRGWSGSMDSPGCRLTLLALLGVLAAVWLCGRGGPPLWPCKNLRQEPPHTACPTRV